MDFFSALIIAVALGMDAFSVAIGVGATGGDVSWRRRLRLSFHFGLFQFLMPVAGWAAGRTVSGFISEYDHWIAFLLLAYVGGKMIWESFHEKEKGELSDPTRGWTLLMLSVATSIDALAVGFSLALLKVSIWYPSLIIGVVAFVMTVVGISFGEKLGKIFGKRVEAAGGLILIAIGLKILYEHMI
jgi:manganese efflux pump family protein